MNYANAGFLYMFRLFTVSYPVISDILNYHSQLSCVRYPTIVGYYPIHPFDPEIEPPTFQPSNLQHSN